MLATVALLTFAAFVAWFLLRALAFASPALVPVLPELGLQKPLMKPGVVEFFWLTVKKSRVVSCFSVRIEDLVRGLLASNMSRNC